MTKMSNKQQQMPDGGIETPDPIDILSGRGKGPMNHPGNKYFREVVNMYKKDFLKSSFHKRKSLTAMIVDKMQNDNPPRRFLRQNSQNKLWYCISHKDALSKTRQSLVDNSADFLDNFAPELDSTQNQRSPEKN